ncbi:HAMP domain-containing protein [Ramlibacter sp. RBP-2]|uniref:HAMP domain-containing protein n=1 Tax=Ramlibacter lithotrophicus TaxID=2606681 RepID=A0A7X6I5N1_9BURK|nr:methyl-accepting chemotaxis protein [Ramlibacter lithotrophicus]NKE65365.1 HAMP domain-containing protein [Ramlibacter lithotrophicus]
MFRHLKIGTKLFLAFGVVLVLIAVLAAVTLDRIGVARDESEELINIVLKKQDLADDASGALARGVQHFKNYILRGGDYNKRFEADMAAIEKAAAAYTALGFNTPLETGQLKKIGEAVTAYRAAMTKLVDLRANGFGPAEMDKTVSGGDKPLADAIAALKEANHKLVAEAESHVTHALATARAVVLWTSAVILLVSIGFALLITRAITRPLAEAVRIAKTVAAGDLTVQVRATSRDETGELLGALKEMTAALSGVVGHVRLGTDAIATASAQIASGNQDLSQRTEEQASSLEETAASIEEVTGAVRQSADNAHQANQLAQSASEVASRGGAVVGEVVETMAGINAASRKVADIITVIDGIAFQTNILALNAAVEAARAGDQGRGFAVVAAEVRSLAQRSAAAAKEIKGLIDDSVGKVDSGTALVARAGETMQEVVASIKRVSDLIGEISAASQEQASGIGQVNQAVAQMEQVTQQNAALVEEASAAAQSLKEQSNALVDAVSAFKLGTDSRAREVIAQAQATSRSVAAGAPSLPTGGTKGPGRKPTVAQLPLASSPPQDDQGWKEF